MTNLEKVLCWWNRTLLFRAVFVNPSPFFFQPFLDQRDRWFLWLPVFAIGGIALYFALPFEPSRIFLALTPFLLYGLFLLRRRFFLAPCLAAFLTLAAGFNAAQIETASRAAPMLDEKIPRASISGMLYRADALPEGSRLVIKNPSIAGMPKESAPRFIRFKTHAGLENLPPPGAQINVWGPLWPPGEPVLPGGYDFRRNAFFKQIGGSGVSYGALRASEIEENPPFFWDGFLLSFEKARRALSLKTYRLLPENQAAMTAALLTGSQTGIAPDVMNAMRASGLSHLLSISGVHVSMIALLLYVPLRALLALSPFVALRWPIKKIAAAAGIVGTIIYTFLVGADAPTVRSALMSGLVLFAVLADRKTLSLRLVALAACLVALAAPSGVVGPSFQMSFAAVLAMIAAYEKRLDKQNEEATASAMPDLARKFMRHGKDIVLTSLIATAATTPFTLFHFQNLSFYGVAANMLAIPLTTLWVMPCLLLTYLAAPFGLEALPLRGAGIGVDLTIGIAKHVAAWPYSQLILPPLPLWAFGGAVLGGLWLCLWRGRFRLFGLLPIAIACFYPLSAQAPSVFISGDGTKWGARLEDGRLALYGKYFDSFTADQWRQRMGKPETLFFGPDDPPNEPGLSCEDSSCRYKMRESAVIFLAETAMEKEIETACAAEAYAIVYPLALPSECRASRLIDGKDLSAHGAQTMTETEDGFRIDSTRSGRGQRPWSAK